MSKENSFKIFAPAKINLFLHLTRKRRDGYHELQSLISFADIGDYISIEPADSFSFNIDGDFSANFIENEQKSHLDCSNLVVRAARALSQLSNQVLKVKITLTKNLPLAAGLGGGSSDAAAAIWGLQQFWGIKSDEKYLLPLMTKLGADVPVCFNCQTSLVEGIGETLLPVNQIEEIPILIINPLISCPTQEIFLRHNGIFNKKINLPNYFESVFDYIDFLKSTNNDLYQPATQLIPEIGNIINAMEAQESCLLTRMSGSGASCFALFETIEQANQAKQAILDENPDWWVKTGWLGRPERY